MKIYANINLWKGNSYCIDLWFMVDNQKQYFQHKFHWYTCRDSDNIFFPLKTQLETTVTELEMMSLIFEILLLGKQQLVTSLIVSPLGFTGYWRLSYWSLLLLSPHQPPMPSYCPDTFIPVPMFDHFLILKLPWGWRALTDLFSWFL